MRKGFLNITVAAKLRTSLPEAGHYNLDLEDGQKVFAIGHSFFPDHDRKLFDSIIIPLLKREKPDVIFVLGGGVHDNAFQEIAPKRADKTSAIHHHAPAPEVVAAMAAGASTESQIMALGASAGDFYRSLSAAAGGATVLYIPSAAPSLPSEAELMKFLYFTQLKLDAFYEKMEEEAPDPEDRIFLPTSSQDFARLLNCQNDEHVQVLRFGSGVLLNDKVLFLVGDFRRRNALTSGFTEQQLRHMSVVKGFDGKLASAWESKAGEGLRGTRRYSQIHEVPNSFDRERLGDLRDYDFWAQGFFLGQMVAGELHARTYPIIPGVDERRCVVVNGVGYVEDTATTYGRGNIVLAKKA
jgi:hypothetical protein